MRWFETCPLPSVINRGRSKIYLDQFRMTKTISGGNIKYFCVLLWTWNFNMNINRKAKHVLHVFLHISERIYPNPLREPFHNPPAAIGGLWMAKLERPHHDPPLDTCALLWDPCCRGKDYSRSLSDRAGLHSPLSSYFGHRINVDRTIIHRLFLDLRNRWVGD